MIPPDRCPVHSSPDDLNLLAPWPCPDDCEFMIAALERHLEDVIINGNYTRTTTVDGVRYRQRFRRHQPVEDPVEWRTP